MGLQGQPGLGLKKRKTSGASDGQERIAELNAKEEDSKKAFAAKEPGPQSLLCFLLHVLDCLGLVPLACPKFSWLVLSRE